MTEELFNSNIEGLLASVRTGYQIAGAFGATALAYLGLRYLSGRRKSIGDETVPDSVEKDSGRRMIIEYLDKECERNARNCDD